MLYTIKNEHLDIQIDDFGAELVRIRFHGKERLWQNENGSWAGHAPVMFPACGSFDIVVDGVKYPHLLHGYARRFAFAVLAHTDTSITFALPATAETKKAYPFDCTFSLTYEVDGDTLVITHTAQNTGDKAMYCAFGAHESYALDRGLEAYRLVFERTEKLDSLIHGDNGTLTGEVYSFGETDTLVLPVAFLENSNTAIFSQIQSNFVTLERVTGEKVATVSLQGFDNLLLWHSIGSQMICIEPWQNLPDYEGKTDVELHEKAGLTRVEAGQTYSVCRSIRYY